VKKLRLVETTEDELHTSVVHLLSIALLPPAIYTHFPAGGYGLTAAAAGRLKRLGLMRGWPDLLAIYSGRPMGIELKRPSGRKSKPQIETHMQLEAAGCPVYVCRTPESVVDALLREEFPVRPSIWKQLLDKPYTPAERECHHGNATPTESRTSQPQESA